jgi:FtsH-binding integral membrane protein
MNFIGLTYLHLFGALIITAISAENRLTDYPIVLIIEMMAIFALIFMMSVTAPGPLKYLMFAAFCYLFGQILASYVERLKAKGSLREVLASVAGIFLAMTIVGFVDNQNFLGFGGYLFAALIGLILARIALLIANLSSPDAINFKNVNTLINWFATVLFAIFVAYDTQRLKHKQVQKSKNYVNSSLGLFLDIINLFVSQDN